MAMTMTDLRALVQERLAEQSRDGKCTQARAREATDAVVGALVTMLAQSDAVQITPGLGTFRVRVSPARDARNPQTGEAVKVPSCYRVSFKPSPALFEGVNSTREIPT